jgi:hypothetical protein
MVSDRAGKACRNKLGQRRGVAQNPFLLARATREHRVLRLEHDPQPGLDGNVCQTRPRFLRLLTGLEGRQAADIRMSLKGVGRLLLKP